MPKPRLHVSIIVPTWREASNIEQLTERIFAAVRQADLQAELIIVDDGSDDGTAAIVQRLAEQYPIRLIVRHEERGLSSAVLRGFSEARRELLVVLDGDGQHPPEAIPRIVQRLTDRDCDFVIATRYADGAMIAESWPLQRRLASRLATWAARPLAPLSDPMSGFFALRRQTWQRAARLRPSGFKIALELYVKCSCHQPAEVPIEFGTRVAGRSKAGLTAGLRFLSQLGRLYWFRFGRGILLVGLLGFAAICVLVWKLSRE